MDPWLPGDEIMASVRKLLLVAASVFLACAVSARAADDVLPLEDAIALALLQNPSVEIAGLDVEKAGEDIDAAEADYFPQLQATLDTGRNLIDQSYTFQQGSLGTFAATGPIPANDVEIGTSGDWSRSVGLSVVQSITGIYQVRMEVEKLSLQQRIYAESLRGELQDTAKSVKQTYYQILASRSALENTQVSIDLYESLVKQLSDEVEQQTALQYELLDAQARLAQARQQALSQRNDIASQKEQLNNLMGRPTDQPFEVAGALVAPPVEIDGEEARQIAFAQRPDLREAEIKVLLAEKSVAITEYGYVPDVDVLASYSHTNSELIPADSFYVGIVLSWEFYDWGQRSAEISSDRIDVHQARIEVERTRSDIITQVNSSLRNLEDAQAAVDAARIGQQAGAEKLRVTQNRYDENVALLSDLFDAESDLSEANDDYVNAVLDVLNAQAELAQAMGEQ